MINEEYLQPFIIKQTIQSKAIINIMNIQLNKIITSIISSNKSDTSNAIQQLFSLMGVYQVQHHAIIQQAILFSMQSLHEWRNLMKYIEKWGAEEFRVGLVKRMRKRLGIMDQIGKDNLDDLKELFQIFWAKKSPQKEENKYKEPIFLRTKIQSIPHIAVSKDIKSFQFSLKKEPSKPQLQTIKDPMINIKSKQTSQSISILSLNKKQKPIQEPSLNKLKSNSKQPSPPQQNISNNISKQRKKDGRLSTHDICKLMNNFQSKQPKNLQRKLQIEKIETAFQNKKISDLDIDNSKITPIKYNPQDIKKQQQSFSFKKEKKSIAQSSLSQNKDTKKQSKKPTIKIIKQSEQTNTGNHHFESFQKNIKWRGQQKKDYTQDIMQVIDMKKNISSISIKQAIDFQQSQRKSLKKQSSSLYNIQSKLMHYNDETILQQLMNDIGKDSLRYLRTLLQ